MIEINVTDSFTEIYVVGGGNFLTENWPTNFHTFAERRVLVPGQTVADFREVTGAQRDKILEAEDRDAARTTMTPIFEGMGAKFNDSTGFYVWNDLFDLTEQDMMTIWKTYQRPYAAFTGRFRGAQGRTYTVPQGLSYFKDGTWMFYAAGSLETVNWNGLWVSENDFAGCYKLRKCIGTPYQVNGSYTMGHLPKLEYFKPVFRGNASLSVAESPLLQAEVFADAVRADNSTAATSFRVHPDVFTKLTGADTSLSEEDKARWTAAAQHCTDLNITITT